MKLKPLGDHVLARLVKEEEKVGSIVIPDTAIGESLELRVSLHVDAEKKQAGEDWEASGRIGLRRGWDDNITYAAVAARAEGP